MKILSETNLLQKSQLAEGMELALEEARLAYDKGEIPVGAVCMSSTGVVLASSHNHMEHSNNALAHAEIATLTKASQNGARKYLQDATLFVTLEPCSMCAGAIAHARVGCLVFGAYDSKSGGVEHGAKVFQHAQCHHKPEVIGGYMESECALLMKSFFIKRRNK